ncbi:hypothetical protein [Pseudoalteromonas galatheae]|uniref:hypothetical protein n=1 Tax=Pseudoalteromonas galatheae TaxID=579562 RepID=UPI0030CA9F59
MQEDVKKREVAFHQAKRSRNFMFYISLMGLIGVAVFVTSYFFTFNSDLYKIFLIADGFAIVTLLIYWYLQVKPIYISTNYQGDSYYKDRAQDKLDMINEIEEAISIYAIEKSNLEYLEEYIGKRTEDIFPYDHDFETFDKSVLTDSTKLKLFKSSLKSIKEQVNKRLTQSTLKEANQQPEDHEKDKSTQRMMKLIDIVTSRLKNEIAQLSKRADIYIVFGSAITMMAGLFLYFTVQEFLELYNSKAGTDKIAWTMYDTLAIAVRFSIVLFIEVFAFYYLRLYRNIMENIKFYQNEITNIEMKILSLHTLEGEKCNESLKILITELSQTERNFVIDKNKTTVDIEKSKLESDFAKSSTDNIVKMVKAIRR